MEWSGTRQILAESPFRSRERSDNDLRQTSFYSLLDATALIRFVSSYNNNPKGKKKRGKESESIRQRTFEVADSECRPFRSLLGPSSSHQDPNKQPVSVDGMPVFVRKGEK